MADIKIHRDHRLGLAKARQIAADWVETVERDYQLVCDRHPGPASDVVEFKRSGISGRLTVAGDHFELVARLGLLLGAFRPGIEAAIARNLDALIGP